MGPLQFINRLRQRSRSAVARLVVYSVVLGVVGGLAGQLFMLMLSWAGRLFLHGIAGYTPPGITTEGGVPHALVGSHGLWLIPLSTTLGGLISGILVQSTAPEAEGHGTDAAVRAYHQEKGQIRGRVPIVKAIASAITIGSGGAAGREGPVAQITAGFGSAMGRLLHSNEQEQRILLLAGVAAGLSAVFRSPLGTAVFAVEVLYGSMEFEARPLIFTMIAAVVGYAVNGAFVGYEPIFALPSDLAFRGLTNLGWYALLGLIMGVTSAALPTIFYRVRDLFRRMPGPPHFRPAVGGLLLGLMALALPQVLTGGYGWMQMIIDGRMALSLLLVLALGKMVAMAFTVSSGGSGGVFAPSLFVGTCLGAAFATAVNHLVPAADLSVSAFAVVGMAAFFSGAARVPMASMLMVVEMTGGYALMVPAMLAVGLSTLAETRVTHTARYPSLYEAQVAARALSPVHRDDYLRHVIDMIHAGQVRLPDKTSPMRLMELLRMGAPIPVEGTGRSIALTRVREEAPAIGKPLRDRPFGSGVTLLSIHRGDIALQPGPEESVQPGDVLVVLISPEAYDRADHSLELVGPVG